MTPTVPMSASEDDRAAAEQLHEQARALDDDAAALAIYGKVLALDPNRPSTHYNIGLIYKYQGRWRESLWHNSQAIALRPDDEATHWNLAIAATALRDWRAARAAWHRLGLPIEEGEGPIQANFGRTPVRLNPDGDAEVVWGDRVDPVRVRIANVPFPGSGFRCGDVVLHDGAPIGYREVDGREHPVFNVLELFEASTLATYETEIRVRDADDVAALEALLEGAGVVAENWSRSVRFLCRQCSEGRPHEQHDNDRQVEWLDRQVLGIATQDVAIVRSAVDKWSGAGRAVLRLDLKLSPPLRH